MKRIKAMIVDDIPLAIASLHADINDVLSEKVEIVATAEGVVEAAKKFKRVKPDLIFLDIQMDDGDGFDLLDIIGKEAVKVIFTTASREHAIRAFRYAAVDYLLKPVSTSELILAVERAQEQELVKPLFNNRITIKSLEALELIELKHIIRLEADNNYTKVFLEDGSNRMVSKTLKSFEHKLNKLFIKTHKSHMVNKDFIKAYIKTEGGYLILTDGEKIPVSVRRRSYIMECLSQ